MHALSRALDADGLQELMRETTSSCARPPDPFPEPRAIDALGMLRRCLGTAVGRATFPAEAAASFILDCFLPPRGGLGPNERGHCDSIVPATTRLAALDLAGAVLPMLPPEAFDGRLPCAVGLVPALLRGAGGAFDVWGRFLRDQSRPTSAEQGAGDTAALALAQLALLRSVCDASGAWADCVAAAVDANLVVAPALVTALSSTISGKGSAETDLASSSLDGLLGALCLLGGEFGTPRVGAEVVYTLPQQAVASSSAPPSTAIERGRGVVLKVSTVVGFDSACYNTVSIYVCSLIVSPIQVDLDSADRQSGDEHEQGLVFTILPDGDASKTPIRVPASGICFLPRAVPNTLVQRLTAAAQSLLPAFVVLLDPASTLSSAPASVDASLGVAALSDLQARTAKALDTLFTDDTFAAAYEPLLPSLARLALAPVHAAAPALPTQRTRVIESRHPYANNTRDTIEVNKYVFIRVHKSCA